MMVRERESKQIENSRRRGMAALILFLLVSLTITAAFIFFDQREVPTDNQNWYVDVEGHVNSSGRFFMEDLRSLNVTKRVMVVKGTNLDGEPHQYTGILLRDLLEDTGVQPGAQKVYVEGVDRFSQVYDIEEVMEMDDLLLAYEMDGRELSSRESGGNGPLWLIPSQELAGEYNGQRSLKFVWLITVRG